MSLTQIKTATVVWIIEDDHDLRSTLKKLLDSWSTLQCPMDFESCEAALELIDSYKNRARPFAKPEVIILDVNLPGMSGIDGIDELKQRFPESQIIMHTIRDDTNTIYSAFQSGASGYLVKDSSIDQIIEAVQQASQGGMIMPKPVASKVLSYFRKDEEPVQDFGLSLRELEVLEKMADPVGLTQKQIAEQLYIAPATVNTHIQHIFAKLHVRCASAAVATAIRKRLIK